MSLPVVLEILFTVNPFGPPANTSISFPVAPVTFTVTLVNPDVAPSVIAFVVLPVTNTGSFIGPTKSSVALIVKTGSIQISK